uniref:Uncharacterized protein n=1 Tax=viral metagenome TaxID=1070528 RepID=A0A6M3IPS7_9ZZZZ
MHNDRAWKVGFKWTVGDASNPTGALAVDTTSKQVHVCDIADVGTDWARSAASHPELNIHSATNPATEYIKMYHDATDAYIDGVGATNLYLQIAGTTYAALSATGLAITAGSFLSGNPAKQTITTKAASADLTVAESGLILASDGVTIQLPTYVSNEALRYMIMAVGTHSSGVYVYRNGESINGAAGYTSTAQWDLIEVIAAPASYSYDWLKVRTVGTWSAS